jgi:Leucine-rich repeat (LRR) protein
MKTKLYSIWFILFLVLVSCSNREINEISETNNDVSTLSSYVSEEPVVSSNSSEIFSNDTNNISSNEFEKDIPACLNGSLDAISEEDLKKINDIIPAEYWKGSDEWEVPYFFNDTRDDRLDHCIEFLLGKPKEEITYGDIWKISGFYKNHMELGSGAATEFPTILREMRNIKLVSVNIFYENADSLNWDNLCAMTWLEEFSNGGYYDFPRKLPEGFKNLTELKHLEITGPIEEVPDIFDSFQKLEYLQLNTGISELPPSFFTMKNLKKLWLHSGNLKYISDDIGNLESLKYLDLSYTRLINIPDGICRLKNLEELWIKPGYPSSRDREFFLSEDEYNRINAEIDAYIEEGSPHSLPENIGDLTNLRSIYVYGFPYITNIPESFKNLTNLKEIGISNDELTQKAEEMVGLE